jgi:hypothetical protein
MQSQGRTLNNESRKKSAEMFTVQNEVSAWRNSAKKPLDIQFPGWGFDSESNNTKQDCQPVDLDVRFKSLKCDVQHIKYVGNTNVVINHVVHREYKWSLYYFFPVIYENVYAGIVKAADSPIRGKNGNDSNIPETFICNTKQATVMAAVCVRRSSTRRHSVRY